MSENTTGHEAREGEQGQEQQEGNENNALSDAKVVQAHDMEYSRASLPFNPGEEYSKPPPLWLVVFSDAMALMLTFFVLLYAMSTPEEDRWQEMTTAFNDGFGRHKSAYFQAAQQDTIDIEKLDMSRALDLSYLQSLLIRLTEENERLKNVLMILQKDRLIISLPNELLFEAGQAQVSTDGKRALFSMGGVLSRIRNRLEVIGHTDPRPVQSQSGTYSSNWELSLYRAAHVAAVLEEVGYNRSVKIRGLSSARYDELSKTLNEEERLGLARRVDIVVLKDDGSRRSFMEMGSD